MTENLTFLFFKKKNILYIKYMYIPANSGYQQHTINNFILGELQRYVRFNTIKKNFFKIKRKFFIRLRNRGYTKNFLLRLFGKIKFGSRNKLLVISADNENYRETSNSGSDTNLINDAERSILSPNSLCNKSKVSCWNYHCVYKKEDMKTKQCFCVSLLCLFFRKQILSAALTW